MNEVWQSDKREVGREVAFTLSRLLSSLLLTFDWAKFDKGIISSTRDSKFDKRCSARDGKFDKGW